MSDDERDLAAAAALGKLSPEEMERLEGAAARSPELAAELEAHHATVSALESALPRDPPPRGLLESVLARVAADEPAATRHPGRGRRWWPPALAVGAAAAAAALLVVALTGGDGLGPADARAAVRGSEAFPDVHGEARLFDSAGDAGRLVLDLDGVPAPGAGWHYEVWVLRDDGAGEMEAVGVFRPTQPSVELELGLPGPGEYVAVDVSVEPDGGSPAHSGRSLAGGRFEPVA